MSASSLRNESPYFWRSRSSSASQLGTLVGSTRYSCPFRDDENRPCHVFTLSADTLPVSYEMPIGCVPVRTYAESRTADEGSALRSVSFDASSVASHFFCWAVFMKIPSATVRTSAWLLPASFSEEKRVVRSPDVS